VLGLLLTGAPPLVALDPMLRYIFNRLVLLVPTFFGISLAAFAFIRLLPGDPILAMAGEHGVAPERYAILKEQFGYNLPIWQQYFQFLWNVLHGNFGISISTKRPVITEFLTLFPATFELSTMAMVFAILVGVPAGIFAAVKRGSWFDQLTMGVALAGYSMPIFWWGLLLIFFFSGYLGWTPVSGNLDLMFFFKPITGLKTVDSLLYGNWPAFVSAWRHLILPSIVLGTIPLAVIARQTRSAMLEVLSEDYVRTARAKGLSTYRVVNVHALRNAMIPVITTIGLQVGLLLAGAILTEYIFAWPGIGRWMIESISKRDYVVVQSGLLIIALIVMGVNLVVDILYAVINPRIRVQS
jgi:dipeptide transport system permease protein